MQIDINVENHQASDEQRPMPRALPEDRQRLQYFARKAVPMRLLALILLVVFSPLILFIVLIVRLTSPGSALYRQIRLGRNGTEFDLLKIRTMYRDAEEMSGPALCMPGDERVTPIGRMLRSLHLDEIPQLINVICGDMCLVGPRPERPEIIEQNDLTQVVPRFSERLSVLPGVTGLAQINLPADLTAKCVIPKVKLDLEYIEMASFGLDLRILLCTALRMMGIRYGRAVAWLRLGRPTDIAVDRDNRTRRRLRSVHRRADRLGTRRFETSVSPDVDVHENAGMADLEATVSTASAVQPQVGDSRVVNDADSLPNQPR